VLGDPVVNVVPVYLTAAAVTFQQPAVDQARGWYGTHAAEVPVQ